MIAVDAMGGDYAPQEVVEGALRAARSGIPVALYGDSLRIGIALSFADRYWHRLPITMHHSSQVIEMSDEPTRAVTSKPHSSLVHAVQAVASGYASAVVSAGNSGAALVAGMVHLGKLPGIGRPAIGGFLPTRTDTVFCIDLGANVECKPEHLRQFAYMAHAYVQVVKGIDSPRIGLLANGAEAGKGTKLIQQAYELLQSNPHFVGNCEPLDVLQGAVDVLVCDGFSGNIMLKSMEATVQVVMQWLRHEGGRSFFARCAALLSAPLFRRLKKHMTKAQRGGALLLGVNKPLVIAHGSSQAAAIDDAIRFAHQVVTEKTYEQFAALVHHQLTDDDHYVQSLDKRTHENKLRA
ncbi:MAG: phosphate acyltransferase PlsX [Candidatus Babeliales bacterium]